MKKILVAIIIIPLLAFIVLFNVRPRPKALSKYLISPSHIIKKDELKVQFIGNTNLLFTDGETSILTDGFFSRPSVFKVLKGKVRPNKKRIEKCLKKAGITTLNAVIPLHSHFDHAMDAAMVTDLTNAQLIGSKSTKNIGIGYGLMEKKMVIPESNIPIQIGKFTITFIPSLHWQYPDPKQRAILLDQEIEQPLITPASIYDYKEGISYTLLIEYESIKMAIQGSAGFLENSIPDFDADILFLAIAGLDVMDETYNQNYQNFLIEPLLPEVLVPIHWDDFTVPLTYKKLKTTNLIFNMKFGSNLNKAFNQIEKRNLNKERKIKVLPLWDPISINDLKKK